MSPSEPKTPVAVCPYCGADPLVLTANNFHFGPWMMQSIFCANLACRKSLALNCLGLQNAPEDRSSIVLPGQVPN